jgi:hypothetical protein
MELSAASLQALRDLITGDKELSPYKSGPELVEFFNNYGSSDYYHQGFPSRWKYAEDKLRTLNSSTSIPQIVCAILDPREYLDFEGEQSAAIDYLNQRLKFDGYEIALKDSLPKIRTTSNSPVEMTHSFAGTNDERHEFIDEQIGKMDEKVRDADYDGAITNARSLLEAVLVKLEEEHCETAEKYDGDLPKLYKRVSKAINLDQNRKDLSGPLKQTLAGFVSIVGGISGLSNKMGDRHARVYRPSRRHAVLVVNSVKTIASFLLDTASEYSD